MINSDLIDSGCIVCRHPEIPNIHIIRDLVLLLDTLIFLSGHTLCLSFLPQLACPGGKKRLFAPGRRWRACAGGMKGCFAHERQWRTRPVGRKGRFAHWKPQRAGPGGRKGCFAHERTRRAGPGGREAVLHTGGAGAGGMRRRAGVSTPGHGQGEGPDGYKFAHSGDAVDVGRGRSERSERSPARCWQTAGKTSITRPRGQEGPFCTREGGRRQREGLESAKKSQKYLEI